MYKSFSEYAIIKETNEFEGRLNDLCESVYFSGLDFDEYWSEYGIPVLLEGNYTSSDELLTELMGGIGQAVGSGLGRTWQGMKNLKRGWKSGWKSGKEKAGEWEPKTSAPAPSDVPADMAAPSDVSAPSDEERVKLPADRLSGTFVKSGSGDPRHGPADVSAPSAPSPAPPSPSAPAASEPHKRQGEVDQAVIGIKKQLQVGLRSFLSKAKKQSFETGSEVGAMVAQDLSNRISKLVQKYSPRAKSGSGGDLQKGARAAFDAMRRQKQPLAGPAAGARLGTSSSNTGVPMSDLGTSSSHTGVPTSNIGYQKPIIAHHKPKGLVVTENLINYAKKHSLR